MNQASSATTKSLTFRYTLALVAIATTCLASQWVIQSLLAKAHSRTHVVNVAGRQRMLSQRIAKVMHRLVTTASNGSTDIMPEPSFLGAGRAVPDIQYPKQLLESQQALLAELSSSVKEFRAMHVAIRDGDDAMGIPPLTSDQARLQLDEIQPALQSIADGADELAYLVAAGKLSADNAAHLSNQLDTSENQFLAGMEQVVSLISEYSAGRINQLIWVERLITCSTLILLLLEAMYVFRPAVRRIGEAIYGLRLALSQARLATKNAQSAIADRKVALSAAALDLTRLSSEIDTLLLEPVAPGTQRDANRFRMLVAHVQATLGKLTDLASGSDDWDEQLVVSRTSPRVLVRDAVQSFCRQASDEVDVNVTMDVRLPASLLVDEQLFHDSIVHLLQSVNNSVGTALCVHIGYDDREMQLIVDIHAVGKELKNYIAIDAAQRESESLDLLLAKRSLERLGGTIRSSRKCDRITVRLPLDETKRMTLSA